MITHVMVHVIEFSYYLGKVCGMNCVAIGNILGNLRKHADNTLRTWSKLGMHTHQKHIQNIKIQNTLNLLLPFPPTQPLTLNPKPPNPKPTPLFVMGTYLFTIQYSLDWRLPILDRLIILFSDINVSSLPNIDPTCTKSRL
jgi:hypothetical protein